MFEKIFAYFSRRSTPLEVYCQTCGRVLTNEGGDIGESGIYCNGYRGDDSRCLDKEVMDAVQQGDLSPHIFNFMNPRQVQRAIRKGHLQNFGPRQEQPSVD